MVIQSQPRKVEDRQAGRSAARHYTHVLRHSFASLTADLGYNEPTIASLLGHKTHSITSQSGTCIPPMSCYWQQPIAVANATMN
jgi:integrase